MLFFRKPCSDKAPSLANFTKSMANFTLKECSCDRGNMDCPANAFGPEPPKVQV